jgi:hypothetical protein
MFDETMIALLSLYQPGKQRNERPVGLLHMLVNVHQKANFTARSTL